MQKGEIISVFAVSIAMIGFCKHYPYLSGALCMIGTRFHPYQKDHAQQECACFLVFQNNPSSLRMRGLGYASHDGFIAEVPQCCKVLFPVSPVKYEHLGHTDRVPVFKRRCAMQYAGLPCPDPSHRKSREYHGPAHQNSHASFPASLPLDPADFPAYAGQTGI